MWTSTSSIPPQGSINSAKPAPQPPTNVMNADKVSLLIRGVPMYKNERFDGDRYRQVPDPVFLVFNEIVTVLKDHESKFNELSDQGEAVTRLQAEQAEQGEQIKGVSTSQEEQQRNLATLEERLIAEENKNVLLEAQLERERLEKEELKRQLNDLLGRVNLLDQGLSRTERTVSEVADQARLVDEKVNGVQLEYNHLKQEVEKLPVRVERRFEEIEETARASKQELERQVEENRRGVQLGQTRFSNNTPNRRHSMGLSASPLAGLNTLHGN